MTLILTSGLINLLALTGSLFMMQVYDRVLGSQSLETLVGLALIAVFAYVLQGVLEGMRTRMLVLTSESFDAAIAPKIAAANLQIALRSPSGHQQAVRNSRNVEEIRGFVSGPGPIAALDLPWLPIYLVVTFILHWSLSLVIVVAAFFLLWLTYMTERNSRDPAKAAQEAAQRRAMDADASIRNTEAIHSMGMRGVMLKRLSGLHETYLLAQRSATFTISGYAVASRTSRMMLQSVMLGLGAYLAIMGQISAGAIIACSILASRALAPIDQAIAGWKPFMAARIAYHNLTQVLQEHDEKSEPVELPAPGQTLKVSDIKVTVPINPTDRNIVVPPGQIAEQTVVQGVRFALTAGQSLAIVGPSASGKSSVGRALVGIWKTRGGRIELDGATLDQWSTERLGRSIGYLPQDVQLFEGTIGENISRFQPDANSEKILAAGNAAGFHDHVKKIGGYDVAIGASGTHLTGGQRQRLGLARALYGDPFLIVLDEPNSNLDVEGRVALQEALAGAKARGAITVVIAHDLTVLQSVDFVLVMERGQQAMYDTRDVVLEKLRLAGQAARSGQLEADTEGGRNSGVNRDVDAGANTRVGAHKNGAGNGAGGEREKSGREDGMGHNGGGEPVRSRPQRSAHLAQRAQPENPSPKAGDSAGPKPPPVDTWKARGTRLVIESKRRPVGSKPTDNPGGSNDAPKGQI